MDYPDVDYLNELALKAGSIIVESFNNCEVLWKEDRTPVTIADTNTNAMIKEIISHDFPKLAIIAEEESREIKDAEYRVICDPMDGTFPFIWGVPISSFCIAIIKGNIPLVGVIYDPFYDRIWYAERGKGAFLDCVPYTTPESIKVSSRNHLAGSSICMTWWKGAGYNMPAVCEKLMDKGVNWFDPKAIAYFGGLLAMGKIEATIHPAKKAWETAAMQVIAEEAGGRVTDMFGDEMVYGSDGGIKGHIISNGLIHDELVALVQSCQ
jgi:histidinol-phosphatase